MRGPENLLLQKEFLTLGKGREGEGEKNLCPLAYDCVVCKSFNKRNHHKRILEVLRHYYYLVTPKQTTATKQTSPQN